MSRLRTDEEKIAILEHCLELERTGGDILGYLWSQDYLTPRATWFNYQREWLGRKPYEFTDGKPKGIKGERKMNNKKDKRKVLEAVITAIERGDDPLIFMTTFGYQAPQAAYAALKKYAKANAPELAPKLPDLRTIRKTTKKAPEKATLAEAVAGMTDAANEFFDKCEEMGLKVNEKEDVRKPVIKPHEKFTVTAVRHNQYGEFYRDFDHHCIDWRTPHGDEVSLEVQVWKAILNDLPEILKRLGVDA